ncbi:MAG TPA: TPM domain-containing protein [Thermoanaerobaculia bacterium]
MRRPSLFLLLLLLLSGAAPALHALDVPPPPKTWFTDAAGVVSTTQAALLDRKLSDFEQASGVQFIIYVFPTLGGEQSMEAFTIRCVEQWKVGQRKYDNGVVLFVFVQDRKMRVETGYGTGGAITDAFSATVIRDVIAPRFRENDYYGGLSAGADAIMAKLRGEEAPVAPLNPRGPRTMPRQGQAPAPASGPGIGTILVILFVIFFVIAPMLGGRRRRRSGCGGCFFPFFMFPGGGGGITFGGGGGGFGGGSFGGGGGGFEGGGGRFGGGGASGGW